MDSGTTPRTEPESLREPPPGAAMIVYPDDPIEDAVCSVCGLAVDVGPGGCSCDREPPEIELEACPDCGVPVAPGEPYAPFCSREHLEADAEVVG